MTAEPMPALLYISYCNPYIDLPYSEQTSLTNKMDTAFYVLRYPIGTFNKPANYSPEETNRNINDIHELPERLRTTIAKLTPAQLDTPYREDGWTVRQVVHHLADSHMNAFIRHRLALTEDDPTINAYREAEWATLPDSKLPIEVSLQLLDSLHNRWATMLGSLDEDQLQRTFHHPESGKWTLEQSVGQYAWHGKHHVAHITGLVQRMGW
jgi:uncharacterized damage-inducible protein DinB